MVIAAVPRMGSWLVVQHDLEPADALVVLMGSTVDRVLEAHDLYSQDMASLIIMVQSRQVGGAYAQKRGLRVPGDADLSKMALTQLGMPGEDIIILPGQASSTMDEARAVKRYLKDNSDISSLILVTSPYHTRRARMIFKNELDLAVNKVQIAPSSYTDYYEQKWYKDRDSAKWTLLEYLKITAWLFRL